MTCKEMLIEMFPEMTGKELGSKLPNCCPGHYGMLPTPSWCDYDAKTWTATQECCNKCWNRTLK